jgi:hypothetical protein
MKNQIATTILAQLGGQKFIVMTGAKDVYGDGNSLGFKLPARTAKNGINFVRVTLNGDDLYNVEFFKFDKYVLNAVSDVRGVYDDMLQSVFTEATGLATRL